MSSREEKLFPYIISGFFGIFSHRVHLRGRWSYLCSMMYGISVVHPVIWRLLMDQSPKDKGTLLFWAFFFTNCKHFTAANLKCTDSIYSWWKEDIFSFISYDIIEIKRKLEKHNVKLTGNTQKACSNRTKLDICHHHIQQVTLSDNIELWTCHYDGWQGKDFFDLFEIIFCPGTEWMRSFMTWI